MTMQKVNCICCLAAALAVWASDSYGASKLDEDAIRAIRIKSNAAIARQDVQGITSFLDSEYQITTGSGAMYQGNPSKESNLWAEHFAEYPDAVYVRTTETVELGTYLPVAAESGHWKGSYSTGTGVKDMTGSYMAYWRNVEGHWKIHAEMFVTLSCTGPGCAP